MSQICLFKHDSISKNIMMYEKKQVPTGYGLKYIIHIKI